jgi:hypothetical protein
VSRHRIGKAASDRIEDQALLGRVRNKVRLLGSSILLARELTPRKISIAGWGETRIEIGKIVGDIDAGAVAIRIVGGDRNCHSQTSSAVWRAWLASDGLLAAMSSVCRKTMAMSLHISPRKFGSPPSFFGLILWCLVVRF